MASIPRDPLLTSASGYQYSGAVTNQESRQIQTALKIINNPWVSSDRTSHKLALASRTIIQHIDSIAHPETVAKATKIYALYKNQSKLLPEIENRIAADYEMNMERVPPDKRGELEALIREAKKEKGQLIARVMVSIASQDGVNLSKGGAAFDDVFKKASDQVSLFNVRSQPKMMALVRAQSRYLKE